MCPGPRNAMPRHEQPSSLLLELAAADDLLAFRRAVHEDSLSLVATSSWYGPSPKAKGPALHLRTPAMVAALYGSTQVLSYLLSIAPSEASRASATDGATPLHLAAQGGAASALAATHLLLGAAGASPDLCRLFKSPPPPPKEDKEEEKKDYGGAPDLPDINAGVFATDEFRMYSFKVNPCSRAYTHDWTECPFAHPGENARRRDPRRFSYTCVPCPDFRKDPASCSKGDACEYAHGVFESWLHPAQYRTRLCKHEVGCPRRICFFAHGTNQLRAVNPSAISMSSSSPPTATKNTNFPTIGMLSTTRSRPVLKASLSSRELDFDVDQYKKHSLLLPRTSPDLIGYFQALSLQQAGGDINMPRPSAHKPPLGSRATAFANRSQSFVDRAPAARSFVPPSTASVLSDWGSPDGKLDWGVQGAELCKSTSFGIRRPQTTTHHNTSSWVKDCSSDILAARWSDQEQMVA